MLPSVNSSSFSFAHSPIALCHYRPTQPVCWFTMSRHNRRRTRASHRNAADASSPSATFDLPDLGLKGTRSNAKAVSFMGPSRGSTKRNELSARHWHNRYLAWQTRERRQREEREKLLAEQTRIFGGEQGEDDADGLCSNMLEYFVGLDFIMEPDGREHA